ncbi:putative efflux protein, MATE family [Thermosyntropha lipolytica DSM 11003]|uniref:Probable multidrug resistance protein NorM n=2 Tax=Thermosyntropha TaxID=54293 RepID=A0A1M5KA22_9FIRM|nr:putative efflux protein, MATE family [Thermosyntropha lipolytica DSM 11003]
MYMIIGVIDVAIVGRLGAAPLAAVGLGAEIFFSLVLLFEALSVGSSVLVAQAKGAGNYRRIASLTLHTLVIGLVIGIIVGAAGLINAEKIVSFFNVEEDVHKAALSYLLITFKITPFAITLYMMHAVFRGMGRTDIPMRIALIVNAFNAAADYVLVYGKLGFPALGVAGAAWATSLAHILGLVLAFYFLYQNRKELFRSEELKKIPLRPQVFRDILSLGSPSLLEQFFWAASNLLSIFLLVYAGTLAYASHQLAITVESISFMPGFGIAIAASVLVGQSIGAKDFKMAKSYARGTLEFALIIMGFFALLFALFPFKIAGLFTHDPDIINLAGTLIRIASLEQLTIASSMVFGGILRGSGNTRTPMLISTFFTWGFRLPLIYLFIRVLKLPITYVWMAFVADWALRTIVYLSIILRRDWLNKALDKEKNS